MSEHPVLYYRTNETRTDSIDALPDSQKIIFDGPRHLSSVVSGGTGNIVTEPEFSPSGEKTYHKQEVGGISENIRLYGNIDISEQESINKLRSFYRMAQIDFPNLQYGKIGFYHNLTNYLNIDPSDSVGYAIEPPSISFGDNSKAVKFDVLLFVGGKNLV